MVRTALVTGANRGIGAEVAKGLAHAGLHVVAGVRDPGSAQALVDAVSADGGSVSMLQIDVGDPQSIADAVTRLDADGTAIDVLVNNAGILDNDDLLALDDATIVRTIDVNALGPLRLMRALAGGMSQRGYGRIVNVSSGWGSLADLGPGAYGISKALLNAITVKLAGELPASVKVNAMDPGWVHTDMGGPDAPDTPQQAADTAVWLALIGDDGPTGQLFHDRTAVDWNA